MSRGGSVTPSISLSFQASAAAAPHRPTLASALHALARKALARPGGRLAVVSLREGGVARSGWAGEAGAAAAALAWAAAPDGTGEGGGGAPPPPRPHLDAALAAVAELLVGGGRAHLVLALVAPPPPVAAAALARLLAGPPPPALTLLAPREHVPSWAATLGRSVGVSGVRVVAEHGGVCAMAALPAAPAAAGPPPPRRPPPPPPHPPAALLSRTLWRGRLGVSHSLGAALAGAVVALPDGPPATAVAGAALVAAGGARGRRRSRGDAAVPAASAPPPPPPWPDGLLAAAVSASPPDLLFHAVLPARAVAAVLGPHVGTGHTPLGVPAYPVARLVVRAGSGEGDGSRVTGHGGALLARLAPGGGVGVALVGQAAAWVLLVLGGEHQSGEGGAWSADAVLVPHEAGRELFDG